MIFYVVTFFQGKVECITHKVSSNVKGKAKNAAEAGGYFLRYKKLKMTCFYLALKSVKLYLGCRKQIVFQNFMSDQCIFCLDLRVVHKCTDYTYIRMYRINRHIEIKIYKAINR